MAFGPLFISISGPQVTNEEQLLIKNPKVSGVILFSENIKSEEQLKNLLQDLYAIKPNLIISIDQEGGRVKRIKFDSFPDLKAPYEYLNDSNSFTEGVSQYANDLRETNTLLNSKGIHINFAPVLDSKHKSSDIICGLNRAFSDSESLLYTAAKIIAKEIKAAKLPMVGKHFIDHGFTNQDSHLQLPTDTRSKEQLKKHIDLYKKLISEELIDIIMPAHIIYPAIDNKPATISNKILTTILREELKFNGVIISDCFSMQAMSFQSTLENINQGISAGLDVAMITHQPAKTLLEIIDDIIDNNDQSKERISKIYFDHELTDRKKPVTTIESTGFDSQLNSGINSSVLD